VVADLRLNPVGGEADPAGPTNRALCVAGGCAAGRRCGRAAGMHPASEELNK
jgi:hypothetical protein